VTSWLEIGILKKPGLGTRKRVLKEGWRERGMDQEQGREGGLDGRDDEREGGTLTENSHSLSCPGQKCSSVGRAPRTGALPSIKQN